MVPPFPMPVYDCKQRNPGNRVGEMSSTLRFHKDNLRHLSRFPDFFVTKRILSTENEFKITYFLWRDNPLGHFPSLFPFNGKEKEGKGSGDRRLVSLVFN